jgi:hypothetical protein
LTTKELPAQFAQPSLWGEADFQQSLMRNAVIIYECVKNNPGVRFEDDTDRRTALTLQAAGLIRHKRGKWYIIPQDDCRWFENTHGE